MRDEPLHRALTNDAAVFQTAQPFEKVCTRVPLLQG